MSCISSSIKSREVLTESIIISFNISISESSGVILFLEKTKFLFNSSIRYVSFNYNFFETISIINRLFFLSIISFR